jgi:hypothetical protein
MKKKVPQLTSITVGPSWCIMTNTLVDAKRIGNLRDDINEYSFCPAAKRGFRANRYKIPEGAAKKSNL